MNDQKKDKEPQYLDGCLIGYGISAAICSVAIVVMSFGYRHTSATAGFDLLCGVGAFGITVGYSVAGKRRTKLDLPRMTMSEFMHTGEGIFVIFVVIAGSSLITAGLKLLLDKLMGH